MQTLIGKDENAWVGKAWTWIHENIKPGQRVFVPAGNTPTPLYRRFCLEPTGLLRSLKFMQIDEILDGPQKGVFRRYFEKELAPFCKWGQLEWIDGANSDSDSDSDSEAGIGAGGLADGVADVAILGVGINGHVAFHEPGLPRNFTSGCVRLSRETLGYLNLREPTWGITYGVSTFQRAKKILVLAQGHAKQSILRKVLQLEAGFGAGAGAGRTGPGTGEEAGQLPIGWILAHPDVTLISDFEL